MILTDPQKAQADALKLTYTEMTVALKMHMEPEVYAKRKAEIQAERDAWDAKMTALAASAAESARHAPRGRGQRPWPEESNTDTNGGSEK